MLELASISKWNKFSTIHNVGLFYFCAHSIQFFLLHFQGSPPLPAQALTGLEVRLEGKLCNPLRSLPLPLSPRPRQQETSGPENKSLRTRPSPAWMSPTQCLAWTLRRGVWKPLRVLRCHRDLVTRGCCTLWRNGKAALWPVIFCLGVG